MSLNEIPQWLGAGVLAAAVGLLGYVGKIVWEAVADWRDGRRKRTARLVQLGSVLRSSKYSFDIQVKNCDALFTLIQQRSPEIASRISHGYERVFAQAKASFTEDETELHDVIRGVTIHSLHPLNEVALRWLKEDDYYKAKSLHSAGGELATYLARLEVHLLLWMAKYAVWIPDHPHHALVFLADEKQHGVGFPRGIEEQINRELRRRRGVWPFSADSQSASTTQRP